MWGGAEIRWQTGVRFTNPKTFTAALAVDSPCRRQRSECHSEFSFGTAVDLEFSSECTSCECNPEQGRSRQLFFIIESGASRTLRYPQHIAVAFTALTTSAVAADAPRGHRMRDALQLLTAAFGRLCCKSRFGPVIENSVGPGRGFRVKM